MSDIPEVAQSPVPQSYDDFWHSREAEYKNSAKFGLDKLDVSTNGIVAHRMWAIGGRPGEGKTTLSLQLAFRWADQQKKKVVYFSNEEDVTEVKNQLAAFFFKLDKMNIQSGNITEDYKKPIKEYFDYIDSLETFKIYDQQEGMSIITQSEILHREKPDLFLLDNIQMINSDSPYLKRHEQIEQYMKTMKEFIMKNKTSAIFISQCNRNAEGRKWGLPALADLKDSGAIEQYCDGVLLLCWPWKLQQQRNIDGNENGTFQMNDFFIEIAKNRYGRVGHAKVFFTPESGRFENAR
jgi:replicative DNA helicase